MNDKIDVQRAPAARRHGSLKGVMQRSPSIDGAPPHDAAPPEDAERIAIDGEGITPQAVEQDAARSFPGEPRQLSKDALSVRVAHRSKEVERKNARNTPHGLKESLDRSRLLAVQTAGSEHGSNVSYWRLFDSIPSWVR